MVLVQGVLSNYIYIRSRVCKYKLQQGVDIVLGKLEHSADGAVSKGAHSVGWHLVSVLWVGKLLLHDGPDVSRHGAV